MANNPNIIEDAEYDEYEALEAEAEQLASTQKEPTKKMAEQQVKPRVQARVAPRAAPRQTPAPSAQTQPEEIVQAQAQIPAQKGPWAPFHQPEVVGIINQETGEVISLKQKSHIEDAGIAEVYAKMLNELSLIIVSGGYQ